jgi:hypothetical protein
MSELSCLGLVDWRGLEFEVVDVFGQRQLGFVIWRFPTGQGVALSSRPTDESGLDDRFKYADTSARWQPGAGPPSLS